MTFHAFLKTKYPLYSDTEIKVNLTVKQLLELVEEFISENSPVFEVKVVDDSNLAEISQVKNSCQNCTRYLTTMCIHNGHYENISMCFGHERINNKQ